MANNLKDFTETLLRDGIAMYSLSDMDIPDSLVAAPSKRELWPVYKGIDIGIIDFIQRHGMELQVSGKYMIGVINDTGRFLELFVADV